MSKAGGSSASKGRCKSAARQPLQDAIESGAHGFEDAGLLEHAEELFVGPAARGVIACELRKVRRLPAQRLRQSRERSRDLTFRSVGRNTVRSEPAADGFQI